MWQDADANSDIISPRGQGGRGDGGHEDGELLHKITSEAPAPGPRQPDSPRGGGGQVRLRGPDPPGGGAPRQTLRVYPSLSECF